MIGIQIAFTGLVSFVFFGFLTAIAAKPLQNISAASVFGAIAIAGFIEIPTGLIIQIWS